MFNRKNKCLLLALVISGVLWHPSVKALELNKETADSHKSWNIKFTQEVDFNEESKKHITVTDSKGTILQTNLRLSNGNTIVVDAPKEGYKEGQTYTINIGDKLHSKKNKYLKHEIKCNFKVKESDNKPSDDYLYKEQVKDTINLGVNKILKDAALKDEDLDDWQVIGVCRQGGIVPSRYLSALETKITSAKGNIGQPTDYERTTLSLMAMGKDPTNFQGYNIIEKIYNNKDMKDQGINAYIFGLIALDSGKFEVPNNALWTREKLIKFIVSNRTYDKGWDYAGDKADPDMTGMALTALSPYKDRADVKLAIDQAVEKLSSIQNENGSFSSWETENSESVSQVIIALCANGIDPTGDKFTKNGKNPLTALIEYRTEDNSFSHIKGTGYDPMATEQAIQALEAYKMFKEGKGSIYMFK